MAICREGGRDLTRVLVHELGHVLRCRPGMTPEAEHTAANQLADEVEREIYPGGPGRDPFQPPAHLPAPRSALDRARGLLAGATAVLGLVTGIVRLIQRLTRRR